MILVLLVEEEAPLVSLQSLEIGHGVGDQDEDQPSLAPPLGLDHLQYWIENTLLQLILLT